MKQLLIFLRQYKKSVATFLLFIAYAGAVFWGNYLSLQKLQQNAQVQFKLETEKQASAIAYFFSERRNDVAELAESAAVTNFFVNRDLGMSYQYGLGVNVQLIEDRFEYLTNNRLIGQQPAFSGFVLIDTDGLPVASSNTLKTAEGFREWLDPNNHEIRSQLAEATGELIVSAPVWINQRYSGELLALTNASTSLALFGRSENGGRSLLVNDRNGTPLEHGDASTLLLQQLWPSLSKTGLPEGKAEFAPPANSENLLIAKVSIAGTPLAFVAVATQHATEDGTSRLFLIAAGVVPLIVLLIAFLDAMERRRVEQMRERAQHEAERLARARSDFLANMSHEIRTPMNAIIGMSELCLATSPNSKQRNYLKKIQRASNSLLRIVNDILDFSKIESGKLEIEHAPFGLDLILDDLGALFSEKAGKKSIELVFDVDESCDMTFIGDPLRLEQILINLIGNAIKFSDQGNITLRVRNTVVDDTSTRLQFEVIDEGIGLSGKQLARLFKAFSQADTSTTRRYGGTGLGLVICKRLVELMGGGIQVESTPDKGSTFRFFVTLGIAPGSESPLISRRQQLAAWVHRPVLVIDDNPVYRSSIAAQLKQLGLQAESWASGEEAMQAVARADAPNYLAVLVDYHMPQMNGVDTIRRLKRVWHDKPAAPIILVSDYSHDQEIGAASSEFDSLLTKPTTTSRLFAELAPFLGIKSLAVPIHEETPAVDPTRFRGLDVLLVDDAPLNQEVVRDMLVNVGIRVRIAKNGREAIDAIHAQQPDAVLMDCQMPIMDGYQATHRLRADERYRDLPIIALTANVLQTEKERCLQAGMNAYLAKPVKSSDLYVMLAAHLPQPAAGVNSTTSAIPTSAGQATGSSDPELINLPGIDSRTGLRYANGKPVLYRKLLRLFLDTHGRDFESGFHTALDKGDWETATRLVHSLKSAAKTIGATDLGEQAKSLEELCHARQPEVVAAQLTGLLREMQAVCSGLSAVGPD